MHSASHRIRPTPHDSLLRNLAPANCSGCEARRYGAYGERCWQRKRSETANDIEI